MSGQMLSYEIFMANVKKIGKDRRGSIIYKKDEKGREIVDRDLYKPYVESTILDFLHDSQGRAPSGDEAA